jgi:hypothetical protein
LIDDVSADEVIFIFAGISAHDDDNIFIL